MIFYTLRIILLGLLFLGSGKMCIAQTPYLNHVVSTDGLRYRLPPQVEKSGFRFAGQDVPLHRPEVRSRVLKEINYLLLDRRSRVFYWLTRSDSLKPVIGPILKKYEIPQEFIFLAAIESNYNARALSSAGAFGYWQFIKSTALAGPVGSPEYDWKELSIAGKMSALT